MESLMETQQLIKESRDLRLYLRESAERLRQARIDSEADRLKRKKQVRKIL